MAFDPTVEIAEIAQREGMWLHVDGAMSGIAALVPEHRWVNAGLDRADSYCTNPHKWMGINFDCDLFWTSDRKALLGALSILPEYLRSQAAESGAVIDYRDWQVPLGRRFRSLKLWFHLRIDGVEPVQEMIREQVRLTQMLAELVDADERFEIVAPHPLNLLCLAAARRRRGNRSTDRSTPTPRHRAVHANRAGRDARCCDSRSAHGRPRSATCAPAWSLLQKLA